MLYAVRNLSYIIASLLATVPAWTFGYKVVEGYWIFERAREKFSHSRPTAPCHMSTCPLCYCFWWGPFPLILKGSVYFRLSLKRLWDSGHQTEENYFFKHQLVGQLIGVAHPGRKGTAEILDSVFRVH